MTREERFSEIKEILSGLSQYKESASYHRDMSWLIEELTKEIERSNKLRDALDEVSTHLPGEYIDCMRVRGWCDMVIAEYDKSLEK